jgi:hypothetical protein
MDYLDPLIVIRPSRATFSVTARAGPRLEDQVPRLNEAASRSPLASASFHHNAEATD